jgi:hypothetical protein
MTQFGQKQSFNKIKEIFLILFSIHVELPAAASIALVILAEEM